MPKLTVSVFWRIFATLFFVKSIWLSMDHNPNSFSFMALGFGCLGVASVIEAIARGK